MTKGNTKIFPFGRGRQIRIRCTPALYIDLGRLNDETDRIDSEIKRLDEIETKYPKQKKF